MKIKDVLLGRLSGDDGMIRLDTLVKLPEECPIRLDGAFTSPIGKVTNLKYFDNVIVGDVEITNYNFINREFLDHHSGHAAGQLHGDRLFNVTEILVYPITKEKTHEAMGTFL